MADEKKDVKPAETTEHNEGAPLETKAKEFKEKKMAPWEHFKQSAHFKKFKSHGSAHMNRRTGGKGG
ncbi:MAG: hypothetical protein LLG37_06900 [Spirochaetia bacterium]|nr:hypothetical protein [Spirochaetia bacterium]